MYVSISTAASYSCYRPEYRLEGWVFASTGKPRNSKSFRSQPKALMDMLNTIWAYLYACSINLYVLQPWQACAR